MRRVGKEQSATRARILDAAQALMVEEGYAAVSARRVASQAGIKPALVQYYFPTMDDLFLAVYRRAAQHSTDRQMAALHSERPLDALWEFTGDTSTAVLAVEFMALANHRKAIRAEIARHVEQSRAMQAEALARLTAEGKADPVAFPLAGILTLLAVSARGLVMEQSLGATIGHEDAHGIVERWLAGIAGAKP